MAKKKFGNSRKKHIAKLGAIELSMTTIVIIVISIIVLIFGIIFGRNVMCSGIQITEDINAGVKNQVKLLFGADKYGVVCVGEGGQEVKIASGGRRKIVCIIKTEDSVEYDLTVRNIQSLKGASTASVNKWVLDDGWKGSVSPGGDGTEAPVAILDIPQDAPTTTLKITIDEVKNQDSSSKKTHTAVIDVVPAGFFRTTMC